MTSSMRAKLRGQVCEYGREASWRDWRSAAKMGLEIELDLWRFCWRASLET